MSGAENLIPVVVQDDRNGDILMVAYANEEALQLTLETGFAHFYSRSRQALWKKGESSGNLIRVSQVWRDCDQDTYVYLSTPSGPACHTNAATCFFERVDEAADQPHAASALSRLSSTLQTRAENADASKSYTQSLLKKGAPKIAEKVIEEATEFNEALSHESDERLVSEAADVLFHLMVGLASRGLTLSDVAEELARREGVSGLEEKRRRLETD